MADEFDYLGTDNSQLSPEGYTYGGGTGGFDYLGTNNFSPYAGVNQSGGDDWWGNSTIGKFLSGVWADPATRNTVVGQTIAGLGGGVLSMLNQRGRVKQEKDLLSFKYSQENEQKAAEVARASTMPKLTSMATPAKRSARPVGWQNPAIPATKRGLIGG